MWTALSQAEGPFLLWVQEFLRQPWLSPIVAFYTKLGDQGIIWIAACLLLLLWPKTRRAGWAGVFALLLSLLCTNILLKHLFTRTRPWLVIEGLVPLVVTPARPWPARRPGGGICPSRGASQRRRAPS